MKNKLIKLFSFLLIAMLFLTGCCQTSTKTVSTSTDSSDLHGTIAISGAFALYPMMTTWASEFQKIHPDVQFDISAGGAGKGMTDTLAGAVDIGMISRTITSDEESKGAYWVAVTKDAVFPVINTQNPVYAQLMVKGIPEETFVKIFITGEITTWGEVVGDPTNTDAIHVYTRSDACGAGDIWAKFLDNHVQDDIQGIGVNGDPGVLDAVAKDPLGIGYNNLGYVFDLTSGAIVSSIQPVPIDVNADGSASDNETVDSLKKAVDLISTDQYPAPPARLEYLATKGKPSGLVQAFIEWILTDGQQYVSTAGYVQLTQDQLNTSLAKIQ